MKVRQLNFNFYYYKLSYNNVSDDYEECHLLGYKNPVRTSQETHYVSTAESSPLMLCKI
jgi:hypothetical protein